jgi:hypothetical protein
VQFRCSAEHFADGAARDGAGALINREETAMERHEGRESLIGRRGNLGLLNRFKKVHVVPVVVPEKRRPVDGSRHFLSPPENRQRMRE